MLTNPRIEEEVRAALDHDPRIKHPELIAVSVDEIGTVVLRGAVGTLPERLAATHDARHVEGVFNVIVDDLRLRPPVGPRRSDDETRAAALDTLAADPRIRATHIHVKVSHGHLTLTGYVREQAESAAAAEDGANLHGVIEVTNRIELRQEAARCLPQPAVCGAVTVRSGDATGGRKPQFSLCSPPRRSPITSYRTS